MQGVVILAVASARFAAVATITTTITTITTGGGSSRSSSSCCCCCCTKTARLAAGYMRRPMRVSKLGDGILASIVPTVAWDDALVDRS